MKSGKKWSKQFLPSVSVFCLMVLVLAACGGSNSGTTSPSSSGKAPASKQILRYPVVGDISTFDPALVEDTDSNFPIQCVFTGLVTLDANLKVQGQLAKSWDTSSDGKTWTFHLKDNLKFSDGTPLTASDVVYSINRTIEPATNSQVSYYLSLIDGYDQIKAKKTLIGSSLIAQDPKTVVIKISQPAAYFLQTLSYPTSYVVEKSLIDKYGKGWTDHLDLGGGAGPFKVQSYSHTKGIELVPNDNYYDKKPALSKLSVDFYTDQDGMYKAFKAKQLDFTPIPPAEIALEKGKPGFRETPLLVIRYLTMNYLVKPFDNIKIRQAFALAINKDAIIDSALKGAFTPTNHFIPQGMQGYDPDLKGPDGTTNTKGNKTLALQLLKEGMAEEHITTLPAITLTFYPRNQGFKDALTAIKQIWSTVLNVNVNISIVARPKLLTLTDATVNNAQGLQMWQAGWSADYPDPQDWLSTFFSKGSDYNEQNYGQNNSTTAAAQQAVQAKLAQADVATSNRMELYNQVEQQVSNDVAWIPLWQEKIQSLTNTKVQNLNINAQELIPPDDWSNIYMSA